MSQPNLMFCGGFSLLISSITGPGLITIPTIFQQAGWVFPVAVFLIVGFLSGSAALFVCEAMSAVEGNDKFQVFVPVFFFLKDFFSCYNLRFPSLHRKAKVEFTTLAELFLGNRYHIALQIILYLTLQSLNIASMIISSQSMDSLLIKIFGRSCGIAIYPPGLVCVHAQSSVGSPFVEYYMLLTGGLLITFGLVFPLGLLNLAENVKVQIASLVALILILVVWMVTFCKHGLTTSNVPAFGSDLSQVIGVVLFNYAFITTIPSVVNSLNPEVSIHAIVWWSIGLSTFMYIVLGLFGAFAYEISSNSNLIAVIQFDSKSSIITTVSTYMFPFAVLITSIPVYTIVIRANFIRGQVCQRGWAIFWSSFFPWLIVIPFQTGWWLNTVINYMSLIFTSSSNFIIPFFLFFASKKYIARALAVVDGPSDEYDLVLIDSNISGRTLNSVHMGSALPSARPASSNIDQSPVSPIITVIPPESDSDPWDSQPHLIIPSSSTGVNISVNLPTIVEPNQNSMDLTSIGEMEYSKKHRPHGLKIIIPNLLTSGSSSPKQSENLSPKASLASFSPVRETSIGPHPTDGLKSVPDEVPYFNGLTVPTLHAPQASSPTATITTNHSPSPLPSPSLSFNISIPSIRSHRSSVESRNPPSILISMTADGQAIYMADDHLSDSNRLSPLPRLSRSFTEMSDTPEEKKLFQAFPSVKWFNSVWFGWVATGLMSTMVIVVLVYDFVVLGLQGLQAPA